MKSLCEAILEAVAYIELRPTKDLEADDDVRTLESIAHVLSFATDEELDELAAAARRAESKALVDDRKQFFGSFMESILDGWKGNQRTSAD